MLNLTVKEIKESFLKSLENNPITNIIKILIYQIYCNTLLQIPKSQYPSPCHLSFRHRKIVGLRLLLKKQSSLLFYKSTLCFCRNSTPKLSLRGTFFDYFFSFLIIFRFRAASLFGFNSTDL